MLYICRDKNTGYPNGVTDILPCHLKDWEKKYIMEEANESFRGKHGNEIKFENGKTRLATKQEIDDYNAQQEQLTSARKKQDALDTLGITTKDIEKIKNLPNATL